jgi:hypothetical protein
MGYACPLMVHSSLSRYNYNLKGKWDNKTYFRFLI